MENVDYNLENNSVNNNSVRNRNDNINNKLI